MRAVVQRVTQAQVRVDDETISTMGRGLLVLLGVALGDAEADADYLAGKVAGLRVFEDSVGKMNLSVSDVGGSVMVVSQFTLLGDCRKGRRPSFVAAADPACAKRLYEHFASKIAESGVPVVTGEFQTMMDVSLVNQGPVTLMLDSRKAF